MSLWTNITAAEATGGKAQGAWEASRVEIDSRRVKPGDLFVALKGENFDGHDYVKEALAKGAVAAVVQGSGVRDQGSGLLVVPDTLKALEDLGRAARKRTHAKIVGVTGSVGKTSAKEMLRIALSAHGETYASSGNFNNHIGAPLNLANLPVSAKFAVFEMGMNHAGEIAHLTKMVRPDVAVITNVEAVHLEFFESLQGIANAKAEIFSGVEKGGVAVLNIDNRFGDYLKMKAQERGLKVVMFGKAGDADGQVLKYEATASGCSVRARIGDKEIDYSMRATGEHWAQLSVMALIVARSLGLDPALSARALAEHFEEPEGRGRQVALAGGVTLIDDSYNASPASMRAAMAKVADVWEARGLQGRKIAALGDMLELGAESAELHSGLAVDLERHGFDAVFTAGKLMKHLHDALPNALRGGHVAGAMELLPVLQKELRAGDILLVKGSHGSKMHELAKALLNKDSAMGKRHAV